MWGAIGAVASTGLGALLGNRQRNIDFDKQRAAAIEDWNRTNEYNLPINVRKRLEEGGFSPALFYKGGSGQVTAQQIKTPDLQTSPYRDPVSHIPETLGKYQDFRVRQAQTNLVKEQLFQAQQAILLDKAKTAGQEIINKKTKAELDEWNKQWAKQGRMEDAALNYYIKNKTKFETDILKFQQFHMARINPLIREEVRQRIRQIKETTAFKAYYNEALKMFGDNTPFFQKIIGGIILNFLKP
jgi:hypothetical protein